MDTKFGHVPDEFCKGNPPKCKTVTELREELKKLPGDLPIEHFSEGCSVVVFNVTEPNPHLSIREIDD